MDCGCLFGIAQALIATNLLYSKTKMLYSKRVHLPSDFALWGPENISSTSCLNLFHVCGRLPDFECRKASNISSVVDGSGVCLFLTPFNILTCLVQWKGTRVGTLLFPSAHSDIQHKLVVNTKGSHFI